MWMARIELSPKHLVGHLAMRCQRIEPADHRLKEPIGRREIDDVVRRKVTYFRLGPRKPRVGDRIEIPEMTTDLAEGKIKIPGDMVQAKILPAVLLSSNCSPRSFHQG